MPSRKHALYVYKNMIEELDNILRYISFIIVFILDCPSVQVFSGIYHSALSHSLLIQCF